MHNKILKEIQLLVNTCKTIQIFTFLYVHICTHVSQLYSQHSPVLWTNTT